MILAVVFLGSSIFAASTNIAYIDTDKVMLESEDTREAQQLFQSEQQAWQEEIQELDSEIQRLQDDFRKKELILTESGKEEAKARIDNLLSEREEKVNRIFGEGGQAMQKNAELLEPILDKLQNVIKEISTEQNIDIVLEASTGGILYAVPALDITDEVIERMNRLAEDGYDEN
jgi:outer membrane protein